ncbi:MAG: ComF family protein [Pseudonocardiaceae bacterium]
MLTPLADRLCGVCQQALREETTTCTNVLCSDPERQFGNVTAVAMKDGPLERKIHRYKYDHKWGWSIIFARLLLGHLERTHNPNSIDLVVACPTYPEKDWPLSTGHTETVLEAAANQDLFGLWPIDTASMRAIIKTGPTPRSAGSSLLERKMKTLLLQPLLRVPDPGRVRGKRILVYDDVSTSGLTINEVARALKNAGAARVDAVVLARQPWRA